MTPAHRTKNIDSRLCIHCQHNDVFRIVSSLEAFNCSRTSAALQHCIIIQLRYWILVKVVPLVLHFHTGTSSTQKWGKTNLFHNGLNPAHVPFLKVNNLNLCACCDASIRRADIEGSKSNVDMSSWLPQASYPCGNFSDTSVIKYRSIQRIVRPTFQCE